MISGEYRALGLHQSKADRSRSRLFSRTALCGVLSMGLLTATGQRAAKADPQGTTVVSGAVDVARQGTHTEFTQHTDTAILTHKSFDIQSNESVNFAQPSSNSLAVNRVVGSDLPTDISGQLTANGNVWVINPSGVAVGNGAQVNVNGLIATTADISNQDILAGKKTFTGAADGTSVTNAGSITAGTGNVVLVAPVVDNSGSITANGSDVALGAGKGFTVDFSGDGLTKFEVQAGNGVSVTSTGDISAQGGAVYISAESADAVQESVVSIGGRVEATRIENKGGEIIISGGSRGVTEVSGTLDASQTSGDGGRIVVTGDKVDIKSTAVIRADGAENGGKIEIGGAFQGGDIDQSVIQRAAEAPRVSTTQPQSAPAPAAQPKPQASSPVSSNQVARKSAPAKAPLPTAKRTIVRSGAKITANAGQAGKGGEVIVWADQFTSFRGDIQATGGFLVGDGGFAEVSGKEFLEFAGHVDLTAFDGEVGQLLLDPIDIVIADGAGGPDDVLLPQIDFVDLPVAVTISEQAVEGAMATVVLQADNSVTINNLSDNTLTMSSGVGLTVQTGAGGFTMDTGDTIAMTGGGNLTINTRDPGATGAGNITLGGVSAAGAGDFTGVDVNFDGTAAFTSLTVSASNNVNVNADVSTTSGALTFNAINDVAVAADITSATGNIAITADAAIAGVGASNNDGDIVFDNVAGRSITATAGTLDLVVSGGVTSRLIDNGPSDVFLTSGTGDFTLPETQLGATTALHLSAVDISVPQNVSSGLITMTTPGAATIGAAMDDANVTTFEITDAELARMTATAAGAGGFMSVIAGGDVTIESALTAPQTNTGGFRITATGSNVVFSGASSFDQLVVFNSSGISGDAASSITTTDTSSFTSTGTVSLLGTANDFALGVDVSAAGQAVSLVDTNEISLGAITSGSLNVAATDIDVSSAISTGVFTATNSAADATTVGGAEAPAAGTFELAQAELDLITATNLVVDSGGGAITVSTADTTTPGTISAVTLDSSAGTGTVTFDSGSSSFAALTVTAGGEVTDSGGGSLDVAGATNITTTGDAVTLDDASNDFAPGLAIDTTNAGGSAAAAITIVDVDPLTTGNITGSTVSLTAGGDLTAGGTITGTSVSITADDFIIAAPNSIVATGGTVDFVANPGNTIQIGETSGGGFDIESSELLQINASTITASSSNENITFDTVSDAARSWIVNPGSATTDIEGVNAFTNLTILGSGDVTTTNGTGGTAPATMVSGTTSIQTTGSPIDLSGMTTANLEFRLSDLSAGPGSTGATVTNGIKAIDAEGDPITISADGGMDILASDYGVENIEFETAGIITVEGGFTHTGGADGSDLTLTSTGAGVVFTTGTTTLDTITVNAAGAITQPSGNIVAQDGTFNATGFNITLAGANDFASNTVNMNGVDLTIVDINAIALGEVTATGNLTVSAGSTITDTVGSNIEVTGTTSLLAESGGDFGDIQLDNSDTVAGDIHNFGGALTATGEDIHIHDVDALLLGVITTNDDSGAAVDMRINNGNNGDLTVRAGSSITQSAAIIVAGEGDFTSQDFTTTTSYSDILLTSANTVGGTLSLVGEDARFVENNAGSIEIANISMNDDGAADATLSLGGVAGSAQIDGQDGVNDGTAGTITVSGAFIYSGTNDVIALDNEGAHSIPQFGAIGSQASIDLNSETGVILGVSGVGANVSANSIDISAENSITQDIGTTINVFGGGTTITAANDAATDYFDVVLGVGSNNITGQIDIAGEDIALTNAAATQLGAVTANAADLTVDGDITGNTGSFTLISRDSVTDTNAQAITVAGVTSITAQNEFATDQFDIALDNVNTHDFSSTAGFNAVGEDITIDDINAIQLGAITTTDNTVLPATTDADIAGALGNLTVRAGGIVSDTANSPITVPGSTSITADDGGMGRFDIVLDELAVNSTPLHDFNSDGTFAIAVDTPNGGASPLTFDGATVTIVDADRLVLGASTSTGDVTIRSNDVALQGALDVNGGAGTLTFLNNNSGGSVGSFGLGDITTIGTTTANLNYRFTNADAENVNAATVVFRADQNGSSLFSNNFDTGGTDMVADFGTLVVDVNEAVFAGLGGTEIIRGNLQVEANNFISSNGAVTVTGTSDLTVVDDVMLPFVPSSDILFTNISNDFQGTVSAIAEDAISLTDANSIALAEVTAAGNLTVTALGGAITDTVGSNIEVTGTTSLVAQNAGLTDQFDIQLDNDITVATDAHNFTGAVTAIGEDIHITDNSALDIAGLTTTDNSALVVDTTINNGNNGDLTVVANGAVTQSAAITVPGETVITTTGDLVNLGTATNVFTGSVSVDTTNAGTSAQAAVTLADAGALQLGLIDASAFTATADGSIQQVAATTVSVTGNSTLTANGVGSVIDLDEAGNDFGTVLATATDDAIALSDVDEIAFGNITGGTLTVSTTNGSMIQTAGSSVALTGATTLTAGGATSDITLGNTNQIAGVFNAAARNIEIDNGATNLTLGDIDAAGNFIARVPGGQIVDDNAGAANGDDVNVGGITTLTAGLGVSVNDQFNDFVGAVNASSGVGIDLLDQNAIVLGNISSFGFAGPLRVDAGGPVTDLAGSTISVEGVTSITANGFDILLDNPGNDFSETSAFNASGGDITITDMDGIQLGTLTLAANVDPTIPTNGGDLVVNAGAAITQSGVATVPGSTDINNTGNAVTLGQPNQFTGPIDVDGSTVQINEAGAIQLGTINADQLTVTAGGTIIDTNARAISVTGQTSLLAQNGGDQFDIVLDNANLHDFSEAADFIATGEDILIDDIDGIQLGALTATVNAVAFADPTISNANGNLTLEIGGNATQTAAATVPGLATLNSSAGGFVLTNAGNDFNSVTGVASGFEISDSNSVSLSTLTANAGNIVVTAPQNVNVLTGTLTQATGNVTLTSSVNGFAGAQGTGRIVADSDTDTVGNVAIVSNGGTAGGDGTSSISGANVSITGTRVTGGDITSTQGTVDLTATTDDVSVGLTGTTTIDAATQLNVVSVTSTTLGNVRAPGVQITTANGGIFDVAGTNFVVPGTTTLTGGGVAGDIVLDETSHDFNIITATGQNVTATDANTIQLGTISATSLTVTTLGGAITDIAGNPISVTGNTTLTAAGGGAFFDVALDEANLHNFDSDGTGDSVSATGGNITLDDVDAIVLGDITQDGAANQLSVIARGDITDSGTIAVAGTTSLSTEAAGGGDIIVDEAAGTFGGRVVLDADRGNNGDHGDVTFVDNDASLLLGEVDAQNVVITSTGTGGIDASTGAQVIEGNAAYRANGGNITLTNNANDFKAIVRADADLDNAGNDAGQVNIVDPNTVQLGAIDAGTLIVDARGGTVTDAAGEGIVVDGATSITASDGMGTFYDVVLDNANVHDFSESGSISVSGGDILLDDIDGVLLGAITANANADATIADNTGTFELNAGGGVTQNGILTVPGTTTVLNLGNSVTLDQANLFGQHVNVTAGATQLVDADALQLGAIQVGSLNAEARGGAITDTAALEIDVAGATTLVASDGGGTFFDIILDNASLHDFDSADNGTSSSAVLGGGGSALIFEGATVTIEDRDRVVLGASTATGPITVYADDVDVTGIVSANGGAGTITFANRDALNTDMGLGDAFGGATTDLTGANNGFNLSSTDLGNLSAATVLLDVDATNGDISSNNMNTGAGIANLRLDAATVTFANAGGGDTVQGNLIVEADTSISSAGGLSVAGTSVLDVVADGAMTPSGTISLGDASNDFQGLVEASASDITLADANDILLGDIDALGNLTVTAGGQISDNGDGAAAGDDVNVFGATSLSAAGDVLLDDVYNDFDNDGTADAVNVAGASVVLQDNTGIVLGSVDANSLLVTTDGSITQNGAGIRVAGQTTLVAVDDFDNAVAGDDRRQDILLNQGNDFDGAVNADGLNITLRDVDDITLGDIDAGEPADATSGTLTVIAGTSIGDDGNAGVGGDVNVEGVTSLTAGTSITLDDVSNDFDSDNMVAGAPSDEVDAAAVDITLVDVNDITLGDIDATGSVSVTAAGTILDDGATVTGEGVDIAGVTSLTAGTEIALNDVVNDFSKGGLANQIDASAPLVTITDANSLVLGDLDISGTASVTALGGDILDDGNGLAAGDDIDVQGVTSLSASGDIVLDDLRNDFDAGGTPGAPTDEVDAVATNITLLDANDIALGDIDAGNGLTVTALTGNVVDDGAAVAGTGVNVGGITSVMAGSDILLDDAVNDFGTGGGAIYVDAAAVGITLQDINDIQLGDVEASGTLSVTASGNITDNGDAVAADGDIDVAGITSLSAGGNVVLDDIFNDFDDGGTAGAPTDEVDVTAANLTLVDVDDIALGDIDVSGGATVTAGGSIVDDGAAISGDGVNIGGITSLSAAADIALDDVVNDLGVYVDASAVNIALADDNALVLGDIDATGNLTVTADGSITDNGAMAAGDGIDVDGTTSLTALDDQDTADLSDDVLQDIVLDDAVNDFGGEAGAPASVVGDAANEIDMIGQNITLADIDGLKLGTVTAGTAATPGNLSITAAGSVTDTDGDVITIFGSTSILASDGGGNFFDIRLDGVDADATDRPHDFNLITVSGEDINLVDLDDLTLDAVANLDATADPTQGGTGSADVVVNGELDIQRIVAAGDISLDNQGPITLTDVDAGGTLTVNSDGRISIGQVTSTNGGINLTTDENFSILPGSAVPLIADGDITLTAPNGSFVQPGAAAPAIGTQTGVNNLPEGLTFRSTNGRILFDFNVGFTVVDLPGTPGVTALTFEAPLSVIRVDEGFFGIGSSDFLSQAVNPLFNPLQSTALINDPSLLRVVGDFGFVSDGNFTVRTQNTVIGAFANEGQGAVVDGVTYLGGAFVGLSLFGTFNGFDTVNSAVSGFDDAAAIGFPAYVPDPNSTANGCVIGLSTSCQPVGTVVPTLTFDDGSLLGIKFVAATEDEDDPFSNRGDEEEWE